jgi:hypothetical protein
MSQSIETRRGPAAAAMRHATIRMGGTVLSGEVAALHRHGATVELAREVPGQVGRWIVLGGAGPLAVGYDMRVIGVEGRRWHLAFDATTAALGIFDERMAARGRRPQVSPDASEFSRAA